MKPLRPCAVSTCPTLTRTTRCPEHTVTREQRNPKDPAQAKFYGSTQWKKIRSFIRKRDPICKLCNRAPTTNVDHIDGSWQNNDPTNLRGLCDPCDRMQTGARLRLKQLNKAS